MKKSSKSGTKLVLVGALVPRDVARALKSYANEEGRTVSQTLKRIIEKDPNIKTRLRAA
jgi:hypothetical protein